MTEVLVRYATRMVGDDGVSYLPQACGGPADNGLWEGWIEFVTEDGRAIRTPRETEQPRRADLFYWAEGLTDTYLEGALARALTPRTTAVRVNRSAPSLFEGPAAGRARPAVVSHAVLDPFAAYAQGEAVLRGQLLALARDHLVNIVRAYRLDVPVSDDATTDAELADAIARTVRNHVRHTTPRRRERERERERPDEAEQTHQAS